MDEQLRLATIAVLRERGFPGLTLERVAEVAGRARSTLWRQGLTREVLIGALVARVVSVGLLRWPAARVQRERNRDPGPHAS